MKGEAPPLELTNGPLMAPEGYNGRMSVESSRRDFLKGKSAIQSLEALADRAHDSSTAAGEPQSACDAERPYLVSAARRAMACQFQVLWNASHDSGATEAALAALDLIDALEAQLTVYRDTSEIAEMNRRAFEEPVSVEKRLFGLLELCKKLSLITGGAFDITSGPLSKIWGFSRREGAVPSEESLIQALACVGSNYLRLNASELSVRFELPGMQLNLGSIGKGYAVDRACEVMEAAGSTDFLIHGGQSSVLARGDEAREGASADGWRIGVLHPWRNDRLIELTLRNEALATSGSGTQFFRHGGKRYGHILDPRTGWPAEGVFTSTVIAPSAAEADGLATAFYVMGVEAALAFCKKRPDLKAILVYAGERGAVRIATANLNDDQWRQVSEA